MLLESKKKDLQAGLQRMLIFSKNSIFSNQVSPNTRHTFLLVLCASQYFSFFNDDIKNKGKINKQEIQM